MATTTYSSEYLAESRTAVLNAFYSIPIPLEILSTAFRLWVKARPSSQGHLAFDDYLVIWATVSSTMLFSNQYSNVNFTSLDCCGC